MNHAFKIHSHIIKSGHHNDPLSLRKLLLFCVRLAPESLSYARSVFDSSAYPDTFACNTIIRAHAQYSPEDALALFSKMQSRGLLLDHFTFPFVLKACARLQIGLEFHSLILKLGFISDVFVQSALINVYGCSGSVGLALKVFDEMFEKDLVSWSSIISCFVNNGFWHEALDVFRQMQIRSAGEPDEVMILSVLSSVSGLGDLELGRWVHLYILRSGLTFSTSMGNALVDMYSRCGSIDDSIRVFMGMPCKTLFTWTSMINGLAVHGRCKEAVRVFFEMKTSGLKPDCITFNSILFACSHGRLIEEGWRIFESIKSEYGMAPRMEHYGCMVDLLSRAGLISEAYEFVKRMPITPTIIIWRTLLAACVNYNCVHLAEKVKDLIMKLTPCNDGDFVLLSNAYGKVGRWNEKAVVRNLMKENKISKKPACSLVNVGQIMHEFTAGENSHPQVDEAREFLISIIHSLRVEGYTPNTTNVLFDIEEEEKEHNLSYHSEKMAVAFAIRSCAEQKTIRVLKNLRICSDCHCFMKHVSKVFDKEIIVRDRSRFHHFNQGSCSCEDYW